MQQLHHHQYMAGNMSHGNQQQQQHHQPQQQQRPQQQSSPSDQSMSTATPPHQVSRASPASTALVMSNTNINSHSRQLTPNTNSSSSNNGTGSSTSSGGGNNGVGHHGVGGPPPNPMIRQFGCHAKSMSAGVVVSVPGISNNLATAAGAAAAANQNNMINNNIAHTNNNQHAHRGIMDPSQQAHNLIANNNHHLPHHNRTHHHQHQQQQQQQQQVPAFRGGHHRNHHHQPSLSQPAHHPPAHQQHPSYQPNHGSANNFNSTRQATSSSTIPSHTHHHQTMSNHVHNRSASTRLGSSALLGPPQNMAHSNHHMNATQPRNYPPHVTNSIWSIDEKISKSQGKLTASGYIPHPYLFNHSVTDMSCDNVSNASRLIDGAPAPGGYYLHATNNLPTTNALSASGSIKAPEFLPICDLMFNLISMIIYFCENTFGIIALIALFYHTASRNWALVGAAFVLSSNVISQYLSFEWIYSSKLEDCRRKREAQEELENEEDCERRYYNRMATYMRNYQCGSCNWLPDSATEVQLKFLLSIALDAIIHIFCLGFLVRYIKLVIPVTDTTRVKREATDLCILRMLHAFIQSAPLLLLQAYMVCTQTFTASITNLSVTAAILSLVNICWALASFTKYARKKYIHNYDNRT